MKFFPTKKERKVKEINGLTNALWFGIGTLIVVFFLLGRIQTELEFRTVVAFAIAYLMSRGYLSSVEQNWRNMKSHVQSNDPNNPNAFWQENLSGNKFIIIIIGIVGVFAGVFAGVAINHPIATPIIGILLSGIAIGWAFLKTESIFVPIIIHGTYNAFVISLKLGAIPGDFLGEEFTLQLLAYSPITVPEIGVSGFSGFSNLVLEWIFQYMLVATSEELLKVALATFFIISFKGKFTAKGDTKYGSYFLATLIWVALHTVQAIKL